jgi:hypothetical protein
MDLIAGDAVGLEGQNHRRRTPAAVEAVRLALPFPDAARDLALEVVARVAHPVRSEDHLNPRRRAPVVADLVGEDGLRVVDDLDIDRLANRRGRRRRVGRLTRALARRIRRAARRVARPGGWRRCDRDRRLGRAVRDGTGEEVLDLDHEPFEAIAGTRGVRGERPDAEGKAHERDHGQQAPRNAAAAAGRGHVHRPRRSITGESPATGT